MSEENIANAPNMTDPGYGYQNYAGPAPNINYPPNYRNPAQGNYRANYAPYRARGYAGSYPYHAVYGGQGENYYEHHDHHDDHEYHDDYGYRHQHQHPYYGGYYPYHNRPPGMGPYQRPSDYMRNWLSYNPVTNWVRSPRGNNFFRGLGIATAGLILAPTVIKAIRPLAIQAVHGMMSIAGEVKGVVADAREELEDVFADAKWDNLNSKEEKLQEGE